MSTLNFKLLPVKVMVTLTSAWVGEQRALFLSIPQIAGLLPDVEVAHGQAIARQEVTVEDERITGMTAALAALDERHDHAIRAVYEGLSGSSSFFRAQEPAREQEAAALERLRDRLLPQRLAYVQRSYLEEAGNAASVAAQLDEETRAQLEAVPLQGGTVLEAVQAWSRLGRELGDLERRRLLLENSMAAGMSDYEARAAWSEVVNTVLSNLKLARKASQASLEALTRPFYDALADAKRKQANKSTAPVASSAPEPEVGAA